ncbi:hypothetical protein RFI_22359 [Reticulomyxa filosa]|uniref:Uncharacterized protein n=1 Tax=Reticulomyxa filosa TaxID=46433 RepID=X6MMD9_RETFI|nr:hypothetical protein RFI_22359 [Reticulomyxa filosa]|eukprot:ETO15009.1 hypothetical protein RFI_22359 [Reticulomyxa filosa]
MKYNVKYSEARNIFTSLQTKYNPQKLNPKELTLQSPPPPGEEDVQTYIYKPLVHVCVCVTNRNALRRHTVATPMQKQEQVTKEQLDEYVNEFVKKHTYHPKDARMLFHFCVEELQLQVKYGAISKAFSSFYTPPADVQRRYSVPQVLTRSGTFVDYDEFMSKKVPPTSNADSNNIEKTDEPTTTTTTTQSSSLSTDTVAPLTTDTSVNDVKEASVRETIEDVKDINDQKQTKEKIVDLTPALFNELLAKYQNMFQKPPQEARQLLTFANENGYNITYGAIRRAWPLGSK